MNDWIWRFALLTIFYLVITFMIEWPKFKDKYRYQQRRYPRPQQPQQRKKKK